MAQITPATAENKQTGKFASALNRSLRHKYVIPGCLIAAFVLRVGWIAVFDAQPVSDFRWYYERGIDLAMGNGYSISATSFWPDNIPSIGQETIAPTEYRPTAYWPVGYPAFLGILFAMLGPSLTVAKIANVLFSMGSLLLSYFPAKTLFRSETAGRVTLLILSFYPNHIAYTSLVATESLFLFLLLAGISLLIAPGRKIAFAGVAGIIFALACLVKPQAVIIPALYFVVATFSAPKRERRKGLLVQAVILHLCLIAALSPWLFRNYTVFDHFVFISNNGGYNLLVGNNPYATGEYRLNGKMASMLNEVDGEYEKDVKARALATRYMRQQPLQVIKLWPKKLVMLYSKDREGFSWNEQGIARTGVTETLFWGLKLVAQVYYLLIMAAFLISLFFFGRQHLTQRQSIPVLGLWIALYFTGISLLTFADSRFHFPVMPWLIMYIGAFVDRVQSNENNGQN